MTPTNDGPTCGVCGKKMTPENSTIHPEFFLCDDCTLTPDDKAAVNEGYAFLNKTKNYLGDGVYVDIERGMLKLTTENGLATTNTIFLEPEVIEALLRYLKDVAKMEVK